MRMKFFKVAMQGGDDEYELNRVLASGRILSVDRQFVTAGKASVWRSAAAGWTARPARAAQGQGGLPRSSIERKRLCCSH